MLKFFGCIIVAGMLLCFGIEGTMRKLDSWGKRTAETTHRVYCDLHKESCDYIERVRAQVASGEPRKLTSRAKNKPKQEQGLTEEQWRQLDKRGKSL